MQQIKFKIVTPEKIVLEDEIDQVTLPTQQGEITILPNHIPLVAVLQPGELTIKKKGENTFHMAVSGGFIEVQKNQVVVLADSAERAEEIDEARAEEARIRAHKLMTETENRDDVQYTAMAAKLEKELARLHVVRKRKRKI